jgi:hypothetical protein
MCLSRHGLRTRNDATDHIVGKNGAKAFHPGPADNALPQEFDSVSLQCCSRGELSSVEARGKRRSAVPTEPSHRTWCGRKWCDKCGSMTIGISCDALPYDIE